MGTPRKPLSKEAYNHFREKVKRGERFHSKKEKDKMVTRLKMYDNGFKQKKGEEVERD